MNRARQIQKVEDAAATIGDLVMPQTRSHELAIIGGGMSGLGIAKAALSRIVESERQAAEMGRPPTSPISSMGFLLGGESLAYSPVRGEFSSYLTVSGFDRYPRVGELDHLRNTIEPQFRDRAFEFDRTARATKIRLRRNGAFRIETVRENGRSYFEARKVVLALGHTLRELSTELRPYVIQGAGDLCVKLAAELPRSNSKEECLTRLLRRYSRVGGETIRIGLAGVGPTTIEVMKILASLLDKPSGMQGKYCVPGTTTPVEIIFYDRAIQSAGTLVEGLCRHIEQTLRYVSNDTDRSDPVRAEESMRYRQDSQDRVTRFAQTNQLKVVPHHVDWERICIHEGLIAPVIQAGQTCEPLSVLIDCAPFQEGIGKSQLSVIDELKLLKIQQVDRNLWRAERHEERSRGRLALVGAAFRPKTEWGVQLMHAQAEKVIEEFYGPKP